MKNKPSGFTANASPVLSRPVQVTLPLGSLVICSVLGFSPGSAQEEGPAALINLGASSAVMDDDWLVYGQWESFRGEDLNGDGDTDDSVLHVENRASGETTNLRLALSTAEYSQLAIYGEWLVFSSGGVQHVHNLVSGETRNLEVRGDFGIVSEDYLVFGEASPDPASLYVHEISGDNTRPLDVSADRWSVSGEWVAGGVERFLFHEPRRDQFRAVDLVVANLATGERRSLTKTAGAWRFSGDWLVYSVKWLDWEGEVFASPEAIYESIYAHRLSTGETTDLELVRTYPVWGDHRSLSSAGDWLLVKGPVRNRWTGETMQNGVVLNLVTGETTQLPYSDEPRFHGDNWLVFAVSEIIGRDLNGDDDRGDRVLHSLELSSGDITNLGLAGSPSDCCHGETVVFSVNEADQGGRDVNGDGDATDTLTYLHDLRAGETTNLGLLEGAVTILSGDWLLLRRREPDRGADLNGDGDALDTVARVHNISTGVTTDLGLAYAWARGYGGFVSGDRLGFWVNEAEQGFSDLNGDGDADDDIFHWVDLGRLDELGHTYFRRGDCNGDGEINLTDAVTDLRHCFGDATVPCAAACDIDGDGSACTGVTDGVRLLMYLFRGGAAPPAPFPECGGSNRPDDVALGCEDSGCGSE